MMNPVVLGLAVGPLAVLGGVYASIHSRLGHRRGVQPDALRHALIASWLSLLGWTLYVLQSIALSGGTAILSVIMIPSVGLPLAVLALPVAWSLSVVVQSWLITPRIESRRTSSWLLAWGGVVLVGTVCVAYGYSSLLQRRARQEPSPERLRALHDRWWTRHDTAVLVALARNVRTPVDVLEELASHDDSGIRYGVARNPGTPSAVLERLYDEVHNRTSLAVNPSVAPHVLRRLATDPDFAVRHNLLFNPSLPTDVLETLRDDPQVGPGATAELRRRRADGGRWHLMEPPRTWGWLRPFTAIPDDAAPMERWARTGFAFDTQEACEATRAEFVRRESSPHRWLRRRCWDCQAADFYSHTRCAFVQP